LIIASDFFAGSKKLINDTCNALRHLRGALTEIKNSTIVEDFKDLTNLDNSNVTFDNCTFEVDQEFNANPETRTLTIRNCNQQSTGAQVFKFTGFAGTIIIENSFKSSNASYDVDDTAAYKLIIDNNSFINAGTNSGSLNKVLSRENRNLPPLVDSGAFLRINGYNILSFSGNNYLTIDGQLLTIDEITSLEFSIYKKWDLKNGNFAFTQWDLHTIYLYNSSDFKSYIKEFTNGSFFKMKMKKQTVAFYILASQLLEILKCENCFTTCLTSTFHLRLHIYNDLPSDFNYFEIIRNESSLKFKNHTKIVITNDPDDLLRNALQAAYPEYVYEYY